MYYRQPGNNDGKVPQETSLKTQGVRSFVNPRCPSHVIMIWRVIWNVPFRRCWISVVSAFRHNELVPRIRIHLDRDVTISGAP